MNAEDYRNIIIKLLAKVDNVKVLHRVALILQRAIE